MLKDSVLKIDEVFFYRQGDLSNFSIMEASLLIGF